MILYTVATTYRNKCLVVDDQFLLYCNYITACFEAGKFKLAVFIGGHGSHLTTWILTAFYNDPTDRSTHCRNKVEASSEKA